MIPTIQYVPGQALKDFRAPLLYPGITINTSPTNHSPIRQLQLQRFNGEGWDPIGDVMSD